MTAFAGLWRSLLLLQAILGLGVATRLLRTAGGARIRLAAEASAPDEQVSVIVPVLNERSRLQPCLDGLMGQGREVLEILVVDGGSEDGTPELVQRAIRMDPRVKLLRSWPVPESWNGKAWGLEYGLRRSDRRTRWLLTIDADVRPGRGLARSLLAQARRTGAAAVSVATTQEMAGLGVAWVHPAMLATLVYRFGIPGQITRRPAEAQANGQCMLLDRAALEQIGGFVPGAHSLCEDVTLARLLAGQGRAVGFYESEGLVSVRMYEDAAEAWRGWSRSLPLRDGIADAWVLLGLLEVLLVQSLPGALLALSVIPVVRRVVPPGVLRLNAGLLIMRLGILLGLRRAYARRPWSFWLSPLLDLPIALSLIQSAVSREHRWRGRRVRREAVRGGVV